MRRAGIAALMLGLLAVGGCRESSGGPSPLTPGPGATVNNQFDEIESTLDSIESELNES